MIEFCAMKQTTVSISKLYARKKNSGILLDRLVSFVQAIVSRDSIQTFSPLSAV